MKTEEIQTAWEMLNLIEKLDQLLWDREEDFIEMDLQEDPCLGPLGPLALLDAEEPRQDKKQG